MTRKLVQNAFIVQSVHRLTNGIYLNNKRTEINVVTRLYIVTLELLSSSDNGCFSESCLMSNCKIEKLMIK